MIIGKSIHHIWVNVCFTGGKIRGRVIGTTLGRIQYTSFSPKNNLVAVCTGFYIVVLLTQVLADFFRNLIISK